MYHLKRSKLFEKQVCTLATVRLDSSIPFFQLEQLHGKKFNIDMQIVTLESASNNADIFKVMQQGQIALQQALKQTSVLPELCPHLKRVAEMSTKLQM